MNWLSFVGCSLVEDSSSEVDGEIIDEVVPVEDISRDHTDVSISSDPQEVCDEVFPNDPPEVCDEVTPDDPPEVCDEVTLDDPPEVCNEVTPDDPPEVCDEVTPDDPPEDCDEVTPDDPPDVRAEVSVKTQLECSICGKMYSGRSSLKRHIQKHTTNGESCSTCGKIYFTKSELNAHRQSYGKKSNCQLCDKVFITKLRLRRHENSVHNNKFLFFCEICGRGFNYTSDLSDHVASYATEATYSCTKCHKKIKCKTNLKRHISTCGVIKRVREVIQSEEISER